MSPGIRRTRTRALSSCGAATPTWPARRSRLCRSRARLPTFTEHFSQSLADAAAARQIAVAAPAKARYLVRGYLTASLVEGGAAVDFVWDVFTPDKQRVQRLSDTIAVKGSGDDAWAMVSDAALDSVAAKCADDLAAYLSNTPEAAPAGAALSYAQ